MVEAYGGPHDMVNSFMYTPTGDLKAFYQAGMGTAVSAVNVLSATPFAVGSVIAPLPAYAATEL